MAQNKLATPQEIVRALGGRERTAIALSVSAYAIDAWQQAGKIPSSRLLQVQELLMEQDMEASLSAFSWKGKKA